MDKMLMCNPESFAYKTRAFITGGRLHFLMFTVNNLPVDTRLKVLSLIFEGQREENIKPIRVFKQGRKLLSVFLEVNSSSLNFQVMDQSKNSSNEASMEATILRCFRDLVAVIYNIGQTKTVVIYQLYQEEYGEVQMTFEERNFVPDGDFDLQERGRRRTRFRLRKILEVENWVVAGSTLHDMFFLNRDTLCLMIDSYMVVWRITGLDTENLGLPRTRYKAEYLRIKIRGTDRRRMNVKKFQLDRVKQRLYYFHGKMIKKSNLISTIYGEKIMTAGFIDISELNEFLKNKYSEKGAQEDAEQLIAPTIGLTETLLKRERPSEMASSISDQGR